MNSQRRNSAKPLDKLEEAGRIQHLVWTGFDTQIYEEPNRRGQGWAVCNLPRKLQQRLYSWRLDRHLVETYSQPKERPPQAEWMPILTMQNTVGKLMEHIVARKLTRDLMDRKILLANHWGGGGVHMGKYSCICIYMTCTKDSRGKNKVQWLWQLISRILTTESS